MSEKNSKKYIFTLIGVDINKIDQKYGFSQEMDNNIPVNTTTIEELKIFKKPVDIVSFLDESKRLRKCTISMIDFISKKEITGNNQYKCFWDRNFIPDNMHPIGCPIKYIPSKASKTYYSEISKEKYTITENVTSMKAKTIKEKKDSKIKIEDKDYYLTDGIFCSLNCCMSYIRSPEIKNDSMYTNSENLLLKIYNDLNPEKDTIEIIPAGHWRTIIDFGGNLSIEKFRESFNRINYISHGLVCVSVGHLFEDQIKF